jgi:putative MATE family efflux protein
LDSNGRVSAPLTEGPILRALLRLSVPIVAANLLQTAYQITDTFWVGRLDAQAVAAVSLSFPINFFMIAIGGGLPIAGSVLIAQYKGRGDDAAMNHVTAQTLMMVLVVSVLLSGIGYALSEPIMHFMGAAPDVLPEAVRFLQVTFLGFIFVFGFFVFQSLMRGLGEVQAPMYIVLVTVLLNLALDPLFIFGWGPIPAWGVTGAALATVCTQALATLIGFTLLFRGHYGIRVHWHSFRPDFKFFWRAFRLGFPTSVEQGVRASGLILMTLLVSTFGTMYVAAYGIGTRFLAFVLIPSMGLSMGTSALVGQNIGAGKLDRAVRTNLISCLVAFLGPLPIGILLFFAAEPAARLFMPEGGPAVEYSATFIRLISFTFGFIAVQHVISGTLRGAGNTLAAMLLSLMAQWVLKFPLAYVLSRHTSLGPEGIWWAHPIAAMLSAIVAVSWFARGDWKRTKLLDDIKLQERVSEEARIEEGITP